MSGPVRPPLTVETIDGATVGRPITKIKVTNGTLAVSGSTATLTISGGGGGTGTVTFVGSSQAFVTVASATTTPSITIGSATGSVTGVLTSTDWTSFNGKQDSITLTTTGSSGAATLIGSTLNIPQYSGGGGGTFSGSLADTQIAFGNTAADSIQGSANLTFDGSNLSVSGYIKSGAGLVTAPTYTFTAADDVGMYLTGTNILHFTAGNTDLMNLQHDGTATNVRLGNGTGGAALSSKGTTNLTLQTNDGVNSGTIVLEDSANGQISITPNGTGTIKLDGVELDNTAIATGYVLKATSATAAGWAAESGGVTFPLEGSDGSSSAPTYSFSSATNLGFFKDGSTALSFTSGGTRQMSFDANGVIRLGGSASKLSTYSNDLVLDTDLGSSSGSIVIEAGANGQISITPNGTGTIKLDGVELDNTAIATGYVLKATSATAAGWAAESAGGGNDFNAELVGVELDASGTGYAVFDILSSPPYGVARYTTGGVDTKQYFYPFIAPKSGSLSEIIVNLTAAAGSATNLYYGFYRDNNGVPSTVLGYATVDATLTGNISVTSFSSTIALTRGTQFWLSQSKSTSQSITQRSIQNDYMPRIAPTEAFPSTTSGYYTSLATNSAVTAVPADITAEGLEGGVYFSGLGSKPHIGIKIL